MPKRFSARLFMGFRVASLRLLPVFVCCCQTSEGFKCEVKDGGVKEISRQVMGFPKNRGTSLGSQKNGS